ncbi:30S ribosomal protein S3, partial [Candidatus Bipolaricaulota bacterium]|nr:30S ribosomal protein S3 [Candidatus Bipolaricaulota bacterium]
TKWWQAKWYAEKDYARLLCQDLALRRVIERKSRECSISRVEIERTGAEVSVTVYSARPGILIGRGGQKVEALRAELEKVSKEKVRLTVREVERPELVACLVAQNMADRIEGRVPFRRVMKQAAFRTRQAGAKGIKIKCAGRLGGREIARSEMLHEGQMPLHTLRANIDYGFVEARTVMGRIGIKVWVYLGDVFPEVSRGSATTEASKVS